MSRPLLLVTLKHWQQHCGARKFFRFGRGSEDEDSPFWTAISHFSIFLLFHSFILVQFWKSSQVIFHNYGQELEVLKVDGRDGSSMEVLEVSGASHFKLRTVVDHWISIISYCGNISRWLLLVGNTWHILAYYLNVSKKNALLSLPFVSVFNVFFSFGSLLHWQYLSPAWERCVQNPML